MKQNQFFTMVTICLIVLAIVINSLSTSTLNAQNTTMKVVIDRASRSTVNPMTEAPIDPGPGDGDGGGGTIGCYTVQIVDCGLNLGQFVWCNFTGAYGPPYHCDGINCYGTKQSRQCVLRVQ